MHANRLLEWPRAWTPSGMGSFLVSIWSPRPTHVRAQWCRYATSKLAAGSLWSWQVRAQLSQRLKYLQTAEAVAGAGARILRGGAYKPRSSPYAFQGLGVEGLKLLRRAREETGLAIVTEVMSRRRCRGNCRIRRHHAGRHTQHGEFFTAGIAGRLWETGFTEAGHDGDH